MGIEHTLFDYIYTNGGLIDIEMLCDNIVNGYNKIVENVCYTENSLLYNKLDLLFEHIIENTDIDFQVDFFNNRKIKLCVKPFLSENIVEYIDINIRPAIEKMILEKETLKNPKKQKAKIL